MGFFDSLYDANGDEWQTKAYGRGMRRFEIGDKLPAAPLDHQVEVLGGPRGPRWDQSRDSFATVRNCHLDALPVERDESLPLLDYTGHWL